MLLDWNNPPILEAPRRKTMLQQRFDREKLARAHMRRAKGPKKHSTNKERSHADSERAKRRRRYIQERLDDLQAYRAQVRAYWLGERDSHPTL
jgi:hypothetical protein